MIGLLPYICDRNLIDENRREVNTFDLNSSINETQEPLLACSLTCLINIVPFFYFVTLLAVVFVAYYLKTLPLNFHITRLGLVLILSGAIGNFLDRVFLVTSLTSWMSIGTCLFGTMTLQFLILRM